MTAWYEEAFGEFYPVLYAHRDRKEALAVARLASGRRRLEGLRLLDLATGFGRVGRALAAEGAGVVGLDLSPELLAVAAKEEPHFPLVRGDMRALPFGDGSLDGVLMIFTSFGYFATDEENFHVLSETARVLKPGGFAMIDLVNPAWIRKTLVPRSERSAGSLRVTEGRRIEDAGRLMIKEISVQHAGEGWTRRWEERVRIYEPDRMRAELRARRLEDTVLWGDYDGAAWDRWSPRLIFWAERVATDEAMEVFP